MGRAGDSRWSLEPSEPPQSPGRSGGYSRSLNTPEAELKDVSSVPEQHFREGRYRGRLLSGASRPSSMHSDMQIFPNTGVRRSLSVSTVRADSISPGPWARRSIAPNSRIKRSNSIDISSGPENSAHKDTLAESPAVRYSEREKRYQQSPQQSEAIDIFQPSNPEFAFQQTDPYQWLLVSKLQSERLAFDFPNAMFHIGDRIFGEIYAGSNGWDNQHRSSPMLSTVTFRLQWNLEKYIHHLGFNSSTPVAVVLDRTLCLTGSQLEAQALTVSEYARQTWPLTCGNTIESIVQNLMTTVEGNTTICEFSESQSIMQTKSASRQHTWWERSLYQSQQRSKQYLQY